MIRIYQVNTERAVKPAFLGYDALKKILCREPDGSDYDLVYEGDVGTEDPEEIYQIFNGVHPKDFKGRSLSVSDVVETDGEFLFCDSIGFRRISFTPPAR